jgi:hypothetical protein
METLQSLPAAKVREVLWSFVEADEFVRAVGPLRISLGEKMVAAPIEKALQGPPDLFLENQFNNRARNFMFELIVGGRLATAGLLPSFDKGPDLQFEFSSLRVAIQCKRPLSMSGMEDGISKAISQLRKDCADLNLVAVSVSRLLNSGDPDSIPEVPNAAAGQVYLDQRGRELAEETKRFWRGKLDRAGILFYGFTPVRWLQPNGHYAYAMLRLQTMCPVSLDESTKLTLRSLARVLGA